MEEFKLTYPIKFFNALNDLDVRSTIGIHGFTIEGSGSDGGSREFYFQGDPRGIPAVLDELREMDVGIQEMSNMSK